jgi:hypothetical protein
VEIVRVRGPDAAHLAKVQLEAIREVLAWALNEWRFWTLEECVTLLRPYVWRRAEAGLVAATTGSFAYLHDGRAVA